MRVHSSCICASISNLHRANSWQCRQLAPCTVPCDVTPRSDRSGEGAARAGWWKGGAVRMRVTDSDGAQRCDVTQRIASSGAEKRAGELATGSAGVASTRMAAVLVYSGKKLLWQEYHHRRAGIIAYRR